MTDYVEVQPLKTFDNGSGLKTAESKPFKVERGEANELRVLGLVSFEDGKKADEPADEAEVEAKPEPEPEPEPAPAKAAHTEPKTAKKKD
ncbi:hypothetical protein ASG25_02050 [Rhizobium sp. Leaf384]|uniref:hypothetical protein n=1 Tax=unclassified Rhizobium TaxID=2613769 RepID=UPI000715DF94|nr:MULTISPECIES: hypothetical protein [unclassified Rhizobium]KQS74222.1 hypothetical protein ASG58_17115 [Rhizobium sp. Leaf383]KQS80417.1 hypothetical protein ASG25_02050 [Rhizobium sp. Leaf384]